MKRKVFCTLHKHNGVISGNTRCPIKKRSRKESEKNSHRNQRYRGCHEDKMQWQQQRTFMAGPRKCVYFRHLGCTMKNYFSLRTLIYSIFVFVFLIFNPFPLIKTIWAGKAGESCSRRNVFSNVWYLGGGRGVRKKSVEVILMRRSCGRQKLLTLFTRFLGAANRWWWWRGGVWRGVSTENIRVAKNCCFLSSRGGGTMECEFKRLSSVWGLSRGEGGMLRGWRKKCWREKNIRHFQRICYFKKLVFPASTWSNGNRLFAGWNISLAPGLYRLLSKIAFSQ